MKLLYILFLIYINYASTQELTDKRYVVKSFPKKVQPGMYQINLSNKYINKQRLGEIQRRELGEQKQFTAFVPIISKNIRDVPQSVPDSLLFPHDLPPETKTRVKKVLPDYVWTSIRKKRSADPKHHPKRKNVGRNRHKSKKTKSGRAKRRSKKARKGKTKNDKRKLHPVKNLPGFIGNRGLNNRIGRGLWGKNAPQRSPGNRKPEVERRLIAARDATIEEYPYVISIQKNKEHWCAGALLNPKLIITTANCMWKGSQISRMKVRVGSRYTDRGGQMFRIQEVMRHPGWRIRETPDCDIALALLNGRVRFSHSVHSVDLPNVVMMPPFDDAWVTSWGSERRDGVYDSQSNSLQVYHVRLVDHETCNNITERFSVAVTRNFICLAQSGRRAPCTRDTGAPAVSDGVLWGLASWGIRKLCGTERYPAMFTYVAAPQNMEFIINATHQLMADERNYPYLDKWPRKRVTPTTPAPLTLPFK